ncbi:MAG: S1C family serine protease [Anaerolineae bacterium]
MKLIQPWLVLVSLLLLGCDSLVTAERPISSERRDLQQVLQPAAAATATVLPMPTRPATVTPVLVDTSAAAYAVEELLINIYQRVSPAVVHIEVAGSGNSFARRSGAGSGFVLDKEGHIVTNNHVIQDVERIRVIFADDTRVDGEVVGTDPAVDLAVIRVNVPKDVLIPVELGNSDLLQVGQRAIAIGNPFRFDQSMTVGIISALGRVVDSIESGDFIPELIQTDAAINPGNSGGPLLNSRGQVIGINTLIFSETGTSAGVGFAVPVNTLRRSLPALLEGRRVGRPWLGIVGPPELDETVVGELDLPSNAGAYVNYVFPGGPADEAGIVGASQTADGELRPGGDLIVAVDGVAVDSFDNLLTYLSNEKRVGQTVKLTVLRGQETRIIPLTLGERPDSP